MRRNNATTGSWTNDSGYEYVLDLNGLGACAAQYSSEHMDVTVLRDGFKPTNSSATKLGYMNLKKVIPLEEAHISKVSRYRAKTLPGVGVLLAPQDKGEIH